MNEELTKTKSELEKSQGNKLDFEKAISELNGQLKNKELENLRTKIAIEYGVPISLANRIVGEDEESIKKDAQGLSDMFKQSNIPPPPLKNMEPEGMSTLEKGYSNLVDFIRKGD